MLQTIEMRAVLPASGYELEWRVSRCEYMRLAFAFHSNGEHPHLLLDRTVIVVKEVAQLDAVEEVHQAVRVSDELLDELRMPNWQHLEPVGWLDIINIHSD